MISPRSVSSGRPVSSSSDAASTPLRLNIVEIRGPCRSVNSNPVFAATGGEYQSQCVIRSTRRGGNSGAGATSTRCFFAGRASARSVDFATALTVSTAVLAPIIPPAIIAVIYAWLADEAVAAMFAAGVIPGILVGSGMAVPVFASARKRNYPKEAPPTLPQVTAALVNALPALMIPVIIMGGGYVAAAGNCGGRRDSGARGLTRMLARCG